VRALLKVALVAPVALLALAACGQTHDPRPNLVLITLDTLRADRVGIYGDERNTPTLDGIARRGVLFEDAIAQATTTPPSHASILTGLNPTRHGLRKLYGQRLAGSNETLAEILRGEGYTTGAFVSAVPLRRFVGLDQGFDFYQDDWGTPGEEMPHDRDARQTNARVREWLDGRPPGPVFLWVHYFDPHYPYYPPAEFRRRYGFENASRDLLPFPTNANSSRPDGRAKRVPGDKAIRKMHSLYRAEIAYLDAAVGELQASLREAGVLPDAVVAFVADHGEHLGESGYYFGHWDVLDETARVPMAIAHPDGRFAGSVVSESVGTIDLVPTLLAWLGIAADLDFDGRDLTPLVAGKGTEPRVFYTEQFEYFPVRSVRSGEWMLRQKAGPKEKVTSGEAILYRRKEGAMPVRVDDQPAVYARLLGALEEVAKPERRHETERLEVPDEVRDQLRALGYTDEARDPDG
jgi:arylsulfatase A-like enzyme